MHVTPAARSGIKIIAMLTALCFQAGCDVSVDGGDSTKVNGSIHVPAGKEAGDVRTVNGSIHVDDNAAVTSATTVNGNIKIGAHATATSLKTVNGEITLGAGAHAAAMQSVNGDLTLDAGADLSGSLLNVNGKITLRSAHVAGSITTVDGSMSVGGASRVDGGILVKKPGGGVNFNGEDPTIVIGPGATVQGELRFERQVKLYVSDKATIGTVTGATAIPFTGDSPPH